MEKKKEPNAGVAQKTLTQTQGWKCFKDVNHILTVVLLLLRYKGDSSVSSQGCSTGRSLAVLRASAAAGVGGTQSPEILAMGR